MIQEGNKLIAEEGKILKIKDTYSKNIYLGLEIVLINGIPTIINITKDDVLEGRKIIINDIIYFITSDTYSDTVTELIRKKYSLDQELALLANIRLNPEKYSEQDKEFQAYRTECKKIAKQIYE